MNKYTFDRLMKLWKLRDKAASRVKRYDDKIFEIYDSCDHKYPNGDNARGRFKCQICGSNIINVNKEL